jgi:glycosyltransferase involved in cell wall biosynthesis
MYQRTRADAQIVERLLAMRALGDKFPGVLAGKAIDVVLAGSCHWFAVPPVARGLKLPSALYLQEPYRPLYEARPRLPWLAEDLPTLPQTRLRFVRHLAGSAARLEPFRLQAAMELENVRAFDLVLVNSRFSRESVERAYGIDAEVCYLGVDADHFAEEAGPRSPFVLSVGELSFAKNPVFLIDALALSETKPKLIWVANRVYPECREVVVRKAQQSGVTVEVREKIRESDLVDLYQRGAICAYAPRLEPFGYVPLEANSCGMPVVGLAEGGVRESIVEGENGLLVDDPGGMARAIDALIRDPSLARRLGASGAARVRSHWTLDAAVDRLETRLTSLVARRAAASAAAGNGQ